jgi:HEPN domain-containing protein
MFDTATAFFLAGERLEPGAEFGPYAHHTVSAPTVVCYAFAVELALKLIQQLESGTRSPSHSLKALFAGLSVKTRDQLPHLQGCADEIDSYFVDWRYPFEKPELIADVEEPRRAFIECYRVIRAFRPDLRSIYEEMWGSFEPEWLRAWPDKASIMSLRSS